jgi:hypothetical protein
MTIRPMCALWGRGAVTPKRHFAKFKLLGLKSRSELCLNDLWHECFGRLLKLLLAY